MKLFFKNLYFITILAVVIILSSCREKNQNLSFMGATLGETLIVDSLKLENIEMNPEGYFGSDAKPALRGFARIPDVTSFPIETLIYSYPEDSVVYEIEWRTESKIDASAIFDLLCSKYGDADQQKDSKYTSDQIHEMIRSLNDRYTSNLISARVSATQAYMNNSYTTHNYLDDTHMLEQYAEWKLPKGNEIQFMGMVGQYGINTPRFIVRYTNNEVRIDRSRRIQEQELQEANQREEERRSQLEKMGIKAASSDF